MDTEGRKSRSRQQQVLEVRDASIIIRRSMQPCGLIGKSGRTSNWSGTQESGYVVPLLVSVSLTHYFSRHSGPSL